MREIDPRYAPFIGRQASMGRRLGAFIVDAVLQVILIFVIVLAAFASLLGCFNVLSVIFIWACNGYTPGKWLLKIRAVKLNGQKISFMDAFMREFLIKSVANGITSGLLNIFSFIWGCVSDVKKTVHDLAAETTVVNEERK